MTETIIISDTHFGVRNNSINWLKHQLQGLDEIIQFIRSQPNEFRVIHCGDLFDSRSSINPYIVRKVQEKINELSSIVESITILGGNHDYYSPEEHEYNITSLDFLESPDNVYIISQEEYLSDNKELFIPWFKFHNKESLEQILDKYDYDIIYTHTDIYQPYPELRPLINKITKPIISGHIHTPNLMNPKRLNIGSCFSIDFNDNNSKRGFYIIKNNDTNTIEFHPLETPIHFYRLYNEDIFNHEFDINPDDKVEFYIDSNKYHDGIYKSVIDDMKQKCDLVTIINSTTILTEGKDIKKFDIVDIIENSIPEHLMEKFEKVKCRMMSKE